MRYLLAGLVLLTGCATTTTTTESPKPAAAQVRLTLKAEDVRGCEFLEVVHDDDMDDMRKKIARRGGNVGHIVGESATPTFQPYVGFRMKDRTTAHAYRCKQ